MKTELRLYTVNMTGSSLALFIQFYEVYTLLFTGSDIVILLVLSLAPFYVHFKRGLIQQVYL